MRILLATGVYPPAIGGPAKQVYDLAHALATAGHTVSVLTFGHERSIEKRDDIMVYTMRRNIAIFGKFLKYFHLRAMLRVIVSAGIPDIVQVNSVRFFGYVVGRYFKARGVPTIIKYAGDFVFETINRDTLKVIEIADVFTISLKARWLRWLEQRILKTFDRIWAQSAYQRNVLVQHLGIPESSVVVMPNYIDIKPYREGATLLRPDMPDMKPRPIILSVSRLVPWKNIEAQMHVAARLKEISTTPFLLYIVGGGSAAVLERLKILIRSMNLMNEVKLLPQVSPTEIHRYFRSASAYLSTSLYEPFGIVFIESMAAGLPIVALETGAVPEVVADTVGFVVQRGVHYIDRLAHRLKIIIENAEVREFFATNGPLEAKQYDIGQHIDKFIALYTSVLPKKNG